MIVFGQFAEQGKLLPYQINLRYLPSYPELMRQSVDAFLSKFQLDAQEFIASYGHDVVFAGLVADHFKLRHVYTFDIEHTFIGAYDVGHKTTLIMLNYEGCQVEKLIELGRRAGLEIMQVMCLLSVHPNGSHRTLLTLQDCAEYASANGLITDIHLKWIMDATHHQD